MTGKIAALGLLLATSINLHMLACQAASPTAQSGGPVTSAGRPFQWPRWYYYDQLGLKEWNKGEKEKARSYFDLSFKDCENDNFPRTKGGAIDPRIKRMIQDVINHQLFKMSMWNIPNAQAQARLSPVEQQIVVNTAMANDVNKNLMQLDRVQRFCNRTLGEKSYEAQALEAYRGRYAMTEEEYKAGVRAVKRPNVHWGVGYGEDTRTTTANDFHGTPKEWGRSINPAVHAPNWWKANEGDDPNLNKLTPGQKKFRELENQRDTRAADWQPGALYVGGKRVEQNKTSSGGQWSSNPQTTDGFQQTTGWGTQNQATPVAESQTKWGVPKTNAELTKDKNRAPWGTDTRDKDPTTMWGSTGSGGNDPTGNTSGTNTNSK